METATKPEISLNEVVKKPIDTVLKYILHAVNTWKSENTEEKIHNKVISLLEKNAEQATLTLLGFENRWGKWEVDHCNGRSGESSIGDYMKKVHAVAIKEFFDSLDLKQIITPALKKKLTTEIKKTYEWKFQEAVQRAARELAEQHAQKLVNELVKTDDLDKTMKMLHLIGADNWTEK